MTKIKMVYFDSVGIDSVTFENRLRNVCQSIYVIKEGLAIVNYDGSAHQLFDLLVPADNRNNVLVTDLDISDNSYWGFMNKDLWTWLSENIH